MPAAGWLHKAANQVNLPSTRAGTAYQVKLLAAGNAAASGTVLSIGLKPATAAIHKTAKPRHLDVEYRGPIARATRTQPCRHSSRGIGFRLSRQQVG